MDFDKSQKKLVMIMVGMLLFLGAVGMIFITGVMEFTDAMIIYISLSVAVVELVLISLVMKKRFQSSDDAELEKMKRKVEALKKR